MYTPIVTTPIIINEFLNLFKNTFSDMKCVFDPTVSVESGIRRRRAWRDRIDREAKDLPLMVWSRSPVKKRDELGERSRKKIYDDTLKHANDFDLIGSLWGETQIDFLIIENDMKDLENIELVLSTFVFQNYFVSIDLEDYGIHNFQLEWEDMSNFDMSYSEKYYLAMQGSCNIVGTFHTIIGDYPRLKEIVVDCYCDVYDEDHKETIIINCE